MPAEAKPFLSGRVSVCIYMMTKESQPAQKNHRAKNTTQGPKVKKFPLCQSVSQSVRVNTHPILKASVCDTKKN